MIPNLVLEVPDARWIVQRVEKGPSGVFFIRTSWFNSDDVTLRSDLTVIPVGEAIKPDQGKL